MVKTCMEVIVSVVTVVGAVAAAGWALNEYYQAQRGDRVTRTLAYQQEFNEDVLFAARKNIGEVWLRNEAIELRILNEKNWMNFQNSSSAPLMRTVWLETLRS